MKVYRKISNYQADHTDIVFQANVPLTHANEMFLSSLTSYYGRDLILYSFPGHLAVKSALNAPRITLCHQYKACLFEQPVQ